MNTTGNNPSENTPIDRAGGVKISLIVATLGRTAELSRLFDSLLRQELRDLELIVVDQNPVGWLDPTLAAYRQTLPLRHLRSATGVSRARNEGLRHARGELVTFPDDDCWFDAGVLDRAVAMLDARQDLDGISGRAYDPLRQVAFGGPWGTRAEAISKRNIFASGVSFTMFFRRAVTDAVGLFDESLGVGSGTPWGSGEETDYLLRALAADFALQYDPELVVFHEAKQIATGIDLRGRAASYGRGMGRVLRKHQFGLPTMVHALGRPLVSACLQGSLLRLEQAQCRLSSFRGRLTGLTAPPDPNWG